MHPLAEIRQREQPSFRHFRRAGRLVLRPLPASRHRGRRIGLTRTLSALPQKNRRVDSTSQLKLTMSKFKFDPNKKDEGSPATNGERALHAASTVAAYGGNDNDECDYDTTTDLLSDIAHMADEQGWDFEAMLKTCTMHWRAER
jgi:hypothetical protein